MAARKEWKKKTGTKKGFEYEKVIQNTDCAYVHNA